MYKASFTRIIFPLLILCTLLGCQNKAYLMPPKNDPLISPKTRILDLVRKLPRNASKEILVKNLSVILKNINQSRRRDLPLINKSFRVLHQQPNIVSSLGEFYQRLPVSNFSDRLLSIKILGALKRDDALSTLLSIVEASEIQVKKSVKKAAQDKTNEMIICKRAVRGIAYLQTPKADKATIRIISTHPSQEVRKEAAWAYLWNKGYSKQAVSTLHEILPKAMWRWIALPRFRHDMDPVAFDKKVRAWRAKWAVISDPDAPIKKDDIPRTRIGAHALDVKPN